MAGDRARAAVSRRLFARPKKRSPPTYSVRPSGVGLLHDHHRFIRRGENSCGSILISAFSPLHATPGETQMGYRWTQLTDQRPAAASIPPVLLSASVVQHHPRIPLQASQLRAFHGAAFKCSAKSVIVHRENIMRQRAQVFIRNHLTRRKRWLPHLGRKRDVPRTHLLGDVSV